MLDYSNDNWPPPVALLIFSSQSLHPLLRYGGNTFCNLHYKPLVNVKYPRRAICVEKNGKNIWPIMISNLFNNLNAVDMWITGSTALSPVPRLFPSSVIFSLTNDLMLIFIYNFHLSDIMASSGLLSWPDKLKNSIIELKSARERCLLAKTWAFISTIVTIECIFMSAQTHTHVNTFNYLIRFGARALILIIPVQGIPPNRQWLVRFSSA